jgi:hypothetical protein
MSIALPLMRRRGPGMIPWLMASRTAVSAEPAPSVPMSRSAVKPAIRSALAACSAKIVRQGTDSSTVCKSSAPGCRNRCTCASMRPGSNVVSPRSITFAPCGWSTDVPMALMRSPSTRISPGWRMFPVSTSSSRAACSTMGAVAGCWAGEPTPATTKMTAPKVGANRNCAGNSA